MLLDISPTLLRPYALTTTSIYMYVGTLFWAHYTASSLFRPPGGLFVKCKWTIHEQAPP